jgi:hypothetical protein
VRLWSPGIAANDATASLAAPDGLKLAPKLDLGIYWRTAQEGATGGAAPGGTGGPTPDMTIKQYRGSCATVKPVQPEETQFGGLTPEQRAAMQS